MAPTLSLISLELCLGKIYKRGISAIRILIMTAYPNLSSAFICMSFWDTTLLLVLIKILIAGGFGVNISKKITEERSTLRREFYNKFAKVGIMF